MALDIDYLSPTYNSYIDIAEADYLITNLEILGGDIGWASLTSQAKEVQIINAVRLINTISFAGTRSPLILVPNMEFPRSGLTYKDGSTVPDTIIPDEIKALTACYVYTWISTGGSGSNVAIGAIKSKTVGGVAISYETGGSTDTSTDTRDDEENRCVRMYLPSDWIAEGVTTISGVGSVSKTRGP